LEEIKEQLERGVQDRESSIKLQSDKRKLDRKVKHYRIHKQQLKVQREFLKTLQEELDGGEEVWYLDFVGFYALDGKKFQSLTLARVSQDSGVLRREWIHCFCRNADAVTVYSCLRFLVEEREDIRRLKKIYLSRDTGSHLSNYQLSFFLSTWFEKWGLEIETHSLPPRHAWSMCDSMGGTIKKAIWKYQADHELAIRSTLILLSPLALIPFSFVTLFDLLIHPCEFFLL
jgi:hypothetical protein